MAEIHDFDDTVVAILDQEPAVHDAVEGLVAAGYEVEVLRGEEGKEHLDPAGESGTIATVKRLLNVFGDQHRIIERLYRELDAGNMVVSVDAKPEEADEAIRILQDHGGHFVWKLGAWTFARIGE
ncbi:MAG TPA: hypothetical protein VFZ80_01175 [Acidimicrobiia bacterium]